MKAKSKLLFLLLAVIAAVALFAFASSAQTGSGTKADPYVITTRAELNEIVKAPDDFTTNGCPNVTYVKLGTDIISNATVCIRNNVALDLNGHLLVTGGSIAFDLNFNNNPEKGGYTETTANRYKLYLYTSVAGGRIVHSGSDVFLYTQNNANFSIGRGPDGEGLDDFTVLTGKLLREDSTIPDLKEFVGGTYIMTTADGILFQFNRNYTTFTGCTFIATGSAPTWFYWFWDPFSDIKFNGCTFSFRGQTLNTTKNTTSSSKTGTSTITFDKDCKFDNFPTDLSVVETDTSHKMQFVYGNTAGFVDLSVGTRIVKVPVGTSAVYFPIYGIDETLGFGDGEGKSVLTYTYSEDLAAAAAGAAVTATPATYSAAPDTEFSLNYLGYFVYGTNATFTSVWVNLPNIGTTSLRLEKDAALTAGAVTTNINNLMLDLQGHTLDGTNAKAHLINMKYGGSGNLTFYLFSSVPGAKVIAADNYEICHEDTGTVKFILGSDNKETATYGKTLTSYGLLTNGYGSTYVIGATCVAKQANPGNSTILIQSYTNSLTCIDSIFYSELQTYLINSNSSACCAITRCAFIAPKKNCTAITRGTESVVTLTDCIFIGATVPVNAARYTYVNPNFRDASGAPSALIPDGSVVAKYVLDTPITVTKLDGTDYTVDVAAKIVEAAEAVTVSVDCEIDALDYTEKWVKGSAFSALRPDDLWLDAESDQLYVVTACQIAGADAQGAVLSADTTVTVAIRVKDPVYVILAADGTVLGSAEYSDAAAAGAALRTLFSTPRNVFAGQTVRLMKDATLTGTITFYNNCIFDLNGHTLTLTHSTDGFNADGVKVAIWSSKPNGKVVRTAKTTTGLFFADGENFSADGQTHNDKNFTGSTRYNGALFLGSNVTSLDDVNTANGAYITFEAGSFLGGQMYGDDTAINVMGGTYVSNTDGATLFYVYARDFRITNCTVIVKNDNVKIFDRRDRSTYNRTGITFLVTGQNCTFYTGATTTYDFADCTFIGIDPIAASTDGIALTTTNATVKDLLYMITEGDAFVSYATTGADAVADGTAFYDALKNTLLDGQEIKLFGPVTVSGSLTLKKSATVDFGGQTVTFAALDDSLLGHEDKLTITGKYYSSVPGAKLLVSEEILGGHQYYAVKCADANDITVDATNIDRIDASYLVNGYSGTVTITGGNWYLYNNTNDKYFVARGKGANVELKDAHVYINDTHTAYIAEAGSSGGSVTFDNCIFESTGEAELATGSQTLTVKFENCTFIGVAMKNSSTASMIFSGATYYTAAEGDNVVPTGTIIKSTVGGFNRVANAPAEKTVTITWKNMNGAVVATEGWYVGSTPTYTGDALNVHGAASVFYYVGAFDYAADEDAEEYVTLKTTAQNTVKAGLSLYDNIVLNLYFADGVYTSVKVDGAPVELTADAIDGFRKFVFAEMAPEDALAPVEVTAYVAVDGVAPVPYVFITSVPLYVDALLAQSTDDTEKQLAADMLFYVKTAAAFFDVADARDLAIAEAVLAKYAPTALTDKTGVNVNTAGTVVAASIGIAGHPGIAFKVAEDFAGEYTVTYTDRSGAVHAAETEEVYTDTEYKWIVTTGVRLYELLGNVTFTTGSETFTYCIADYVAAAEGDAKTVAEALYNYAASAKAYFDLVG